MVDNNLLLCFQLITDVICRFLKGKVRTPLKIAALILMRWKMELVRQAGRHLLLMRRDKIGFAMQMLLAKKQKDLQPVQVLSRKMHLCQKTAPTVDLLPLIWLIILGGFPGLLLL